MRQRLEGLIPEILRRTFYAGLGAVFTTEEGLRKLAADFSLPKDVANYLIHQAQSTKDDLFRIVAAELRQFLEGLDIERISQRILTGLVFEIKAELRFRPSDEIIRSEIKPRLQVKKRGKEEPAAGGENQ